MENDIDLHNISAKNKLENNMSSNFITKELSKMLNDWYFHYWNHS